MAIADSGNSIRPMVLLEKLKTVGMYTIFIEDVVFEFFFKVCMGCLNDFVEALSEN